MIPPDVYQKGIEAVLKYLREYLPEMAFIDNSSMIAELAVYYNSKEFSDVTFHCKGQSFVAHRVILAARCPSFVVSPNRGSWYLHMHRNNWENNLMEQHLFQSM